MHIKHTKATRMYQSKFNYDFMINVEHFHELKQHKNDSYLASVHQVQVGYSI